MKVLPVKLVKNTVHGGSDIVQCASYEATHLQFNLPCRPKGALMVLLPVQLKGTREGTNNWSWNGSVNKPTLKPSVLLGPTIYGETVYRTHCFINDGMVKYLQDCSHDLKGQTIEMPDVLSGNEHDAEEVFEYKGYRFEINGDGFDAIYNTVSCCSVKKDGTQTKFYGCSNEDAASMAKKHVDDVVLQE